MLPLAGIVHLRLLIDESASCSNKTKLRFIYGKWTDYLKSAAMADYDTYMQEHAQSFRAPDKPEASPTHTTKRVFSKLNSLTRQFTGGSIDQPADCPDTLPPELDNNGDIPKSDSSHSLGECTHHNLITFDGSVHINSTNVRQTC